MMRYLSVCSGIEAATAAWHPLGWKPVAFSEIDAFPRALLQHHYPDTPLHGDFTTIRGDEYGPVDLLVGGTPCQEFSIAGQRAGLVGERGNLTLEYARLARRCRARWFVWENVFGVFTLNSGRDFGAILAEFAGYPAGTTFAVPGGGWRNAGVVPAAGPHGHGLAWRTLDAQFAGVPQRRRRVFVVGYLGDWRPAAAVLFERHSLQGHPPPCREARKEAAGATAEGAGSRSRAFGGGRCSGEIQVSTCLTAKGQRQDFEVETFIADVAQTLAAGGNTSGGNRYPGMSADTAASMLVAHTLRGEGFDASEDGTGRGIPLVAATLPVHTPKGDQAGREGLLVFDTTQITSPGNRSSVRAGEPCHPLASSAHAPAIAFDSKASGRNGFAVGEISPTLRAMGHKNSHSNAGGQVAVAEKSSVRRLTPRECERLQGFPDDYTQFPYRNKPAADGPRYKALGNSKAVPVVRWIGERIAAVDQVIKAAG